MIHIYRSISINNVRFPLISDTDKYYQLERVSEFLLHHQLIDRIRLCNLDCKKASISGTVLSGAAAGFKHYNATSRCFSAIIATQTINANLTTANDETHKQYIRGMYRGLLRRAIKASALLSYPFISMIKGQQKQIACLFTFPSNY